MTRSQDRRDRGGLRRGRCSCCGCSRRSGDSRQRGRPRGRRGGRQRTLRARRLGPAGPAARRQGPSLAVAAGGPEAAGGQEQAGQVQNALLWPSPVARGGLRAEGGMCVCVCVRARARACVRARAVGAPRVTPRRFQPWPAGGKGVAPAGFSAGQRTVVRPVRRGLCKRASKITPAAHTRLCPLPPPPLLPRAHSVYSCARRRSTVLCPAS